jgi:polar amino acid transport system substrate-binding protein
LVLVAALGLGACTSSHRSVTGEVVAALAPGVTTTTAPAGPAVAPTTVPDGCGTEWEPTQSFAPTGGTAGSGGSSGSAKLAEIRERGWVRIGVDENTVPLAYRDPQSLQLVGMEVDLAKMVAEALLGNASKLELITVTTDQKVSAVEGGTVDMTISAVSMTCPRWQRVWYSAPYYQAFQRVMVRNDSPIEDGADLDGRTVCVTAGSSSLGVIEAEAPNAKPYEVETRTECLAALQRGLVDSIFTHDTFLSGFAQQDRNVRILREPRSPTSYGIAVLKGDLELVRQLNGLLEQWRQDGTLDRLAATWITDSSVLRPVPTPEYRAP